MCFNLSLQTIDGVSDGYGSAALPVPYVSILPEERELANLQVRVFT